MPEPSDHPLASAARRRLPGGAPAQFEEALLRFLRSSRVARARVAREPAFAGITLAQYQLLDAVDRVGGHGNARIAELSGVSGATATQALSRLEGRGLVRRAPAAADGRSVTVTLTDRGRELLAEKRAFLSERARALFESLEPPQRERASEILDRLADFVEQF